MHAVAYFKHMQHVGLVPALLKRREAFFLLLMVLEARFSCSLASCIKIKKKPIL
jgi:hypothetical protein